MPSYREMIQKRMQNVNTRTRPLEYAVPHGLPSAKNFVGSVRMPQLPRELPKELVKPNYSAYSDDAMNYPVSFYGFSNSLDTLDAFQTRNQRRRRGNYSAYSATSAISTADIDTLAAAANKLLADGLIEQKTYNAGVAWDSFIKDSPIDQVNYYFIKPATFASASGSSHFGIYMLRTFAQTAAEIALLSDNSSVGTWYFNSANPSSAVMKGQLMTIRDKWEAGLSLAIGDRAVSIRLMGIVGILAKVAGLGAAAPLSSEAAFNALKAFFTTVKGLQVTQLFAAQQ